MASRAGRRVDGKNGPKEANAERDARDQNVSEADRGGADAARLNEQFLELHLRPLDAAQAEEFIRRWFNIVETALTSQKKIASTHAAAAATELIDHLQSADIRASRIFAMTRNPLLLTAICLVHRDRGRLPERRVDLYHECVNILLERWREAKRLEISFDATKARRVLQPVAWFLHQQRSRTRATAQELESTLEPPLTAVGWEGGSPVDFLETIRDESGLLTGWSGESYGFMHLGFQEYLAARELMRLCQKDLKGRVRLLKDLAARFGQSWWREVTLLFLALEGAPVDAFYRALFGRVEMARNADLLDLCVEEATEFPSKPFIELLTDDPGRRDSLTERQLAGARVLKRQDPTTFASLKKKFANHPDSTLAALFQERNVAARTASRHDLIEFVAIPGGRFLMGADLALEIEDVADVAWTKWMKEHATPMHRVDLSSFELGKYPVTNREYGRFVKETGHREPAPWADSKFNQPEQPVVGVSWNDATAFCRWAKVRLPTEAEWEYACRGQIDGVAGQRTRFWSGDAESDLGLVAWYRRNSAGSTKPVGGKAPNRFGLYDTHGNVREWCHDRFGKYTLRVFRTSKSSFNSSGRVLRGGSWSTSTRYCLSSYRDWSGADNRYGDVGFRVARGQDALRSGGG